MLVNLFVNLTMYGRVSLATLIDNIFTNELDSTISSGLLINDISDHLIFAFLVLPVHIP